MHFSLEAQLFIKDAIVVYKEMSVKREVKRKRAYI